MKKITKLKNYQIDKIMRLRKRAYRQETGLTIVEGYAEVKCAQKAGVKFHKLYICPEVFTLKDNEFAEQEIVYISREDFAAIAFGARLKGILAICKPTMIGLEDLKFPANPLVVIMDSVEKPGNFGAVLRSCDGAGVDAVIACEPKTDIYNQNIVRSSIGMIFHIPTVEAANEELLSFLRKKKFQIIAATSGAKQSFTKTDFRKPTAILVGNEHQGLSQFWFDNADVQVSIPMTGEGKCLNVAISASILIYESLRQKTQ